MKQSIALVILQIVNIVLGFVSVFWIAASIPAEVYAITAIYAVISSFLLVFSNTGLETYAIRNVLAWQQNQEYTKIKTVITQAVVLRTLLGAILVLPAIGYSFYISTHKFNGQHFSLFVTMSLISITVAYSDSVMLILKSFNRYFSAAFAVFVLRVIGRIVALMLFIKYGFEVYIHTVIFLPMIVAIPITIMLSKWINLKYLLQMKPLVENLKRSRAFTFSAYISYLYGYADQLLVTVFLSPELIGSFSIGKRLFEFAKQFVENIFDPQLQKLVSYKNNLAQLSISFDKIWKLRNIILSIGVLMTPLIFVIIDPVIIIIGLEQYSNLNYLLVVIFISQVLHVAMKVKSNFISIFYHQKYFFIITVVTAITSIISLLILLSLFNFKYIFMYVVITNFVMTIYTSKVFNKNNGILYRTFK